MTGIQDILSAMNRIGQVTEIPANGSGLRAVVEAGPSAAMHTLYVTAIVDDSHAEVQILEPPKDYDPYSEGNKKPPIGSKVVLNMSITGIFDPKHVAQMIVCSVRGYTGTGINDMGA